ncbi:MAG TPA: hypothetical protein PLO71_09595, partial [Thauera phenylacetica]|nr:hypothetical protein [Thauera phenylacetica]
MSFAPIYLDWNATTPLDPVVREAMLPWLGAAEPARFGNASSRHEYGRQARAAVAAQSSQAKYTSVPPGPEGAPGIRHSAPL